MQVIKIWEFQVGYVEEPDLLAIVEPCGYFYVHQACASWSQGVTRPSIDMKLGTLGALTGVDLALIRSVSIRCQLCGSYGASLTCPVADPCASVPGGGAGTGGCSKSFHFPCAVSAGSYFNVKTYTSHCSDHVHQGSISAGMDAQCVICRSPGNVLNQVHSSFYTNFFFITNFFIN